MYLVMLNRVSNILFSLLLLFTVSFSACKDETTTPPPPCTDPGHLEVRVSDNTSTNYFGGAEVYLYNTAAERDADVSRTAYLSKKLTDTTDPTNFGATFYSLDSKTYYFFAKWTNGTNTFTGKGEGMVTTCKTAVVFCKVS